jgi:hypothetical protein
MYPSSRESTATPEFNLGQLNIKKDRGAPKADRREIALVNRAEGVCSRTDVCVGDVNTVIGLRSKSEADQRDVAF